MSDLESQIKDLIEYKKLKVKLESELKLKEEENQKILKRNKELKELAEEMEKELANQSKTKLKDIGLLGYQISEIEVKLQLEGLDLKGNY